MTNIFTLALSQEAMWAIGLSVVVGQFIFNVIFGLALASMNRKTSRIDRLEENAQEAAKDLVDQRLAKVSAELIGAIDLLGQRVDHIVDRLKAGDLDLKALNDRDHVLELKFAGKIENLKDWMRDVFATREHAAELERRINQIASHRSPSHA